MLQISQSLFCQKYTAMKFATNYSLVQPRTIVLLVVVVKKQQLRPRVAKGKVENVWFTQNRNLRRERKKPQQAAFLTILWGNYLDFLFVKLSNI